jgi:hypothetical protein
MHPHDKDDTAAPAARELGDETVEIQLTAEEQLLLSRAEELATRAPCAAPEPEAQSQPGAAAGDNFVWQRTARIDAFSTATFVIVGLCIAGGAWHGHRAVPSARIPAIAAVTAAAAPARPVPVVAEEPPLQLRNPFDRSEVFEFPAATSEDRARELVAALLLQRAQGRLSQPGESTRAVPRRLSHSAQTTSEVFVTKLTAANSN